MKDKEMIASYQYGNAFYEIFLNNNGKISVNKISESEHDNNTSEIQISRIVLFELINMCKMKYGQIKYNNNLFNITYNSILDSYSFQKEMFGEKIPCNLAEQSYLNQLFNEPVYYYLNNNRSTWGNSYAFGSSNSNQSTSQFGSTFTSDDDLDEKYEAEKRARQKRIEEEKKRNKVKKVFISIGSILLSVCISVVGVMHYFEYILNGGKVSTIDITSEQKYSQNVNIDEMQIEEMIRNSLKDEKPWVIESIIEYYKTQNGLVNKENNNVALNARTQTIIDSIKNNSNIEESEKNILISNFSNFFNNYIQYISDESYELICERLSTFKIVKSYNAEGKLSIGGIDVGGQYKSSENTIYLYNDYESTLTHEFTHMLGAFSVYPSGGMDHLTEGYVELLNPLRSENVYGTEQIMDIILGEIYGREFMMKNFFSQNSLMTGLYNQMGVSYYEDNPHWDFVKNHLSEYLNEVFNYHYTDLMSEPIRDKTVAIMDELKKEYYKVTGLNWDDNEILKACFDLLTRSNTLGLNDGESVDSIYMSNLTPKYIKKKDVQINSYDENSKEYNMHFMTAYGEVDQNNNEIGIRK